MQVAAAESNPSLVDFMLPNVDNPVSVLRSLKEAAAKLSPIVRNRIFGIPQYILEYSDLVVANHVQAPFLKPFLVTGPETGERSGLLQALVDEFPDVFAFARAVSDQPAIAPRDPALVRCCSSETFNFTLWETSICDILLLLMHSKYEAFLAPITLSYKDI